MRTKDIECQLAQGQIGRYLNGDRFSDVAVQQLEAHIAECEECTALLAERKKAVMAMLGEVATTRAAVHMEVPNPTPKPAEKLIAVLSKTQVNLKESSVERPRPKATFTTFFPKPVLYMGALALVLMGMSYFSRGAIKAFGPTASQGFPDEASKAPAKAAPAEKAQPVAISPSSPQLSTAATTNTPTTSAAQKPGPTQPTLERVAPPTPAAARSVPLSSTPTAHPAAPKPKAIALKPVVKAPVHKPAAPAPVAAKAKVKVVVHQLVRRRPRRLAVHRSGVRVYDSQGRPIN
jgi:hypothetical protein